MSRASGGGSADPRHGSTSPHAVVEIDLGLPQESIDALAVTPGEYQDGTFALRTAGGTYGPYDGGRPAQGEPTGRSGR